jgi:hypothetical protein
MSDKQTAGIGKGTPGPGRPKGSVNRNTRLAKDAIAEAAEGLGGADRLMAWAQEDPANERVFWGTIYPKLIPVTLAGDPENPLQHAHTLGLSATTQRFLESMRAPAGSAGSSPPVPD